MLQAQQSAMAMQMFNNMQQNLYTQQQLDLQRQALNQNSMQVFPPAGNTAHPVYIGSGNSNTYDVRNTQTGESNTYEVRRR